MTRSATSGSRDRFFVGKEYEAYFPKVEHSNHNTFLDLDGQSLKSEPRTRVVLLRRETNGAAKQESRSFVIKIYHYPFWPRIRTGLRIAKAEQEFNSLCYLKELGVSAVQPVGYGVQRSALGFVRSCFVITAFEEGTVTLLKWNTENAAQRRRDTTQNQDVLRQIGKMFRRLHQAHFFLFTTKTKNLLIRSGAMTAPEIFFIDLPYARTLWPRPLARWGQGRDLGVFFGNFFPALTETQSAAFYKGYLPDPLGGSVSTLRRRVEQAARSRLHLTPISGRVHQFKRILREQVGRFILLAAVLTPNSMELFDYLNCSR